MADNPTVSAKTRYTKLESDREKPLERARESAKLTLPFVMPEQGLKSGDEISQPYSSFGARAVDNLSAKLLIALLPPNSPFFRLQFSKEKMDELAGQTGDSALSAKADSALAKVEKRIMDEVENNGYRVAMFEALRHLVVTGNVLLHINQDQQMRVFHMDKYVCVRDATGSVVEILIKEEISPTVLPPEMKSALTESSNPEEERTSNVELYTWVRLVEDKWIVDQEIEGNFIATSHSEYPKDKLPFLPLRFSRVAGDDYGRGFVESYMGDLISLEGYRRASVEGIASLSRIIWLIDPGSRIRVDKFANANNGDVLIGRPEEVQTIQANKSFDFSALANAEARLENELGKAFLLNSAVQRNAERVTAEEIRTVAEELEQTLGGVYSILAQELQLPLLNIIMTAMQKASKLTQLPSGAIEPRIVTGLDALGRGADLQKLLGFYQNVIQLLGPESAKTYIPYE